MGIVGVEEEEVGEEEGALEGQKAGQAAYGSQRRESSWQRGGQ